MGISLVKGGNISLTKQAGGAGLSVVVVGLGWDLRSTTCLLYTSPSPRD